MNKALSVALAAGTVASLLLAWPYARYTYKFYKVQYLVHKTTQFNPQSLSQEDLDEVIDEVIETCEDLICQCNDVIDPLIVQTPGKNLMDKLTKLICTEVWIKFWYESKAQGHYNLGKAYVAQLRFIEGHQQLTKALTLYEVTQNFRGLSITYNDIGMLHQSQQNPLLALESYEKASLFFEQHKMKSFGRTDLVKYDYTNEATICSNLAQALNSVERYEEAKKYLIKALEIDRKADCWKEAILDLKELAFSYEKTNMFKKAVECYNEQIELAHKCYQYDEIVIAKCSIALLCIASNLTLAENMCRSCILSLQDMKKKGFTYIDEGNADKQANNSMILTVHRTTRVTVHHQMTQAKEMLAEILIRTRRYDEALVTLESLRSFLFYNKDLALAVPEAKQAMESSMQLQDIINIANQFNSTIVFYTFSPNLMYEQRQQRLDIWIVIPGSKNVHYEFVPIINSLNDCLDTFLNQLIECVSLMRNKLSRLDTNLINDDAISEEALKTDLDDALHKSYEKILIGLKLASLQQSATIADKLKSTLEHLYTLLIRPIESYSVTKRLIIVPHTSICLVPFYALLDPLTGQYLIDRHTITQVSSLQSLTINKLVLDNKPAARVSTSHLFFVNPIVKDTELTTCFSDSSIQLLTAGMGRAGITTFGHVLNKEMASKEGLSKHLLQNCPKFLFMAAPAPTDKFERVDPSDHIVLRGDVFVTPITGPASTKMKPLNTKLKAQEIAALPLHGVELVSISSCELLKLPVLKEGGVGLCAAFMIAGAASVMGSLWRVHPIVSLLLMHSFFKSFKFYANDKAECLRQAMLQLKQEYPNPLSLYIFIIYAVYSMGVHSIVRLPQLG